MSVYDEWVKAMTTPEAVERARRWYLEDLRLDLEHPTPMPFVGDPVTGFAADDRRLAAMHGYRPAMAINLRPPRPEEKPLGYLLAVRRAFRRIRREWWTRREQGGLMTLGRPAVGGERWEGIG